MLERHQNAEIAGGWIDGPDKRDKRDQHEMLDIGEGDTGRRHQCGTEQHQGPKVVSGSDHADRERQQRSSK
jgi:hypothetical protein